MNNFKIYRENKYDVKENLKMRIRNELPIIIAKVDNFFVNH